MIWIGIDPGANTGVAVWDGDEKKFVMLKSITPAELYIWIVQNESFWKSAKVIIEDPYTWKPFIAGKNNTAKLQGVGMLKARYTDIVNLLDNLSIPYIKNSLHKTKKKVSALTFTKITGYTKATNEHSRDAAMMVYGRT